MPRPSVQWTSAVALIAGLWAFLFAAIPSDVPAVEDEVSWLAAGDITYRLVRDRAGPSEWEHAYAGLDSFGVLNPPLGKLVFGAALATVKRGDRPVHYRWDFRASRETNLARGVPVPPAHAQAARIAMSLFSAVSLGLLALMAYQLTGSSWLSLLAPSLLASFAAFEHSATRIYTDAPQLAAMLGGMVAFQRHLTSHTWRSLCAAGVLMGLSVAVKYSSAPIIAVMGLFALIAAGSPLQRVARAALLGTLSVAVFIAVNPYLYPDPFGRTFEIISGWGQLMDRISQAPHWASALVASPWEGLLRVAQRGMLAPAQSYASAAAAPWLGLGLLATAGWVLSRFRVRLRPAWKTRQTLLGLGLAALGCIGWGFGVFGLWAWLFLLGLVSLIGQLARQKPADPRRLVVAFFLASLCIAWLATGAWLQLDWPRYSLRVLVLTPCVHVAGLIALRDLFRCERRSPPHSA